MCRGNGTQICLIFQAVARPRHQEVAPSAAAAMTGMPQGEGGNQHLVARPDASVDEGQVQRGRAGGERQRLRRADSRSKPCPE